MTANVQYSFKDIFRSNNHFIEKLFLFLWWSGTLSMMMVFFGTTFSLTFMMMFVKAEGFLKKGKGSSNTFYFINKPLALLVYVLVVFTERQFRR